MESFQQLEISNAFVLSAAAPLLHAYIPQPDRFALFHHSQNPKLGFLVFCYNVKQDFTASAKLIDKLTHVWISANMETGSAMEQGEVRDPPREDCFVVGSDKSK